MNERYSTYRGLWLPNYDSVGLKDKRFKYLNKLINPPSHLGNIEAMADERSLVYSIGRKDRPRVFIFVSFDLAIRLENLRK